MRLNPYQIKSHDITLFSNGGDGYESVPGGIIAGIVPMTRSVHLWRRLGKHPQRMRRLSCQATEAALQPKNDDSVHNLERNWTSFVGKLGRF